MRVAARSWVGMLVALAMASGAAAHVTVWPKISSPGAFEKYTVRVPTEGTVATTKLNPAPLQ
jgi:uncharacterized protein YcnI